MTTTTDKLHGLCGIRGVVARGLLYAGTGTAI
jgi:hypothetical protein